MPNHPLKQILDKMILLRDKMYSVSYTASSLMSIFNDMKDPLNTEYAKYYTTTLSFTRSIDKDIHEIENKLKSIR